MPVVANPNPDRARRGAVTPAAEEKQDPVPQELMPIAPAAAPTTTITSPEPAAPAAAPRQLAPIAPIFGHAAVRQTGLEQSNTARKRHAIVQRNEPCWLCVEITDEEDAHQPRWR